MGYNFVDAFSTTNGSCIENCQSNKNSSLVSRKVLSYTQFFSCYAPPLIYGKWCSSGYGIFGKDTVTISVEPIGDTTLFCEVNCCNHIAEFLDEITCKWDCAGQPAIRCYGNPTGANVRATQLS